MVLFACLVICFFVVCFKYCVPWCLGLVFRFVCLGNSVGCILFFVLRVVWWFCLGCLVMFA